MKRRSSTKTKQSLSIDTTSVRQRSSQSLFSATTTPALSDDPFLLDSDTRNDMHDEHESDDGSTTRCPCGSTASNGLMVQCEDCSVWQHTACIGLSSSKKRLPRHYYCELCRPNGHPYYSYLEKREKSIGKSPTMSATTPIVHSPNNLQSPVKQSQSSSLSKAMTPSLPQHPHQVKKRKTMNSRLAADDYSDLGFADELNAAIAMSVADQGSAIGSSTSPSVTTINHSDETTSFTAISTNNSNKRSSKRKRPSLDDKETADSRAVGKSHASSTPKSHSKITRDLDRYSASPSPAPSIKRGRSTPSKQISRSEISSVDSLVTPTPLVVSSTSSNVDHASAETSHRSESLISDNESSHTMLDTFGKEQSRENSLPSTMQKLSARTTVRDMNQRLLQICKFIKMREETEEAPKEDGDVLKSTETALVPSLPCRDDSTNTLCILEEFHPQQGESAPTANINKSQVSDTDDVGVCMQELVHLLKQFRDKYPLFTAEDTVEAISDLEIPVR